MYAMKRIDSRSIITISFAVRTCNAMASIWIDHKLTRVDDYRSAYHKSKHIELFGTDKPVAFITGSAAPRVGNCIARYFLSHGYRVAIHARESRDEGERFVKHCVDAGLECVLLTGQIEDEKAVANWVQQIDDRFGRLDAVIHSAASWDMKSLEATSAADVMDNLSNHALGSFLVAQHAGLYMTKQETGGSVVLTGDWAVQRPYPGFASYFAGKATIPTLTRTFAAEFASRNRRVRANCILPGIMLLAGNHSPNNIEQLENAALVKRLGDPIDIAAAAMQLCESTFITGECLHVDGGRHCYSGPGIDAIAHPEYAVR
jgi:pteridine reductase